MRCGIYPRHGQDLQARLTAGHPRGGDHGTGHYTAGREGLTTASRMLLEILGCHGGSVPKRRLPSFLINGHVLLEAGSVTSALPLGAQAGIEHVLISHAHLDHTVGLAFLVDNIQSSQTAAGPERRGDGGVHRAGGRRPPQLLLQQPALARLHEAADARGARAQAPDPARARADRVRIPDRRSRCPSSTRCPAPASSSTTAPRARLLGGHRPDRRDLEGGAGVQGHPRDHRRDRLPEPPGEPRHDVRPLHAGSPPARDGQDAGAPPLWIYHIKPAHFEETSEELERLGDRIHILEQDQTHTF